MVDHDDDAHMNMTMLVSTCDKHLYDATCQHFIESSQADNESLGTQRK